MQIRCFKCQMPIALGRDVVAEALEMVKKENLTRYDVRCPKCRTTNRVSKKQLTRMAPRISPDKKK
ncbi:MAG: hypothetical protein ISR58_16670 [Anaerolineales bacterium]|nr:hypothetical protein [Chloroflexota bacterium]MBL6982808.1 hypothetical protein [Anaerolineales bacterium]